MAALIAKDSFNVAIEEHPIDTSPMRNHLLKCSCFSNSGLCGKRKPATTTASTKETYM
jgi:hypothetical protein